MIQLSNSRHFVTLHSTLNKLSRNAHHIYSLQPGPCFSFRTELDQIPIVRAKRFGRLRHQSEHL